MMMLSVSAFVCFLLVIVSITRACNPGATGEPSCRYPLDSVALATGTTGYGGGDGPFTNGAAIVVTVQAATESPPFYWDRCGDDLRHRKFGPFKEIGGPAWEHGTKKKE
jgi:hypothetical protein